ncbi:MAG: aminotransferase class I/II-fold pyridoxal phosphate-dependent enzyme [Gammaproteobacteria bacterium]|nr:aminotransferase class I/II-fold pyridoxal phosphate-dependent enzyme [Gammaproteobacteria bacterium]
MKKSTRVNHPPRVELPKDNRALVSPIYQSVKFEFESLEQTERSFRGERPGFFYSRASNPTVRELELLLAELQGRAEALAVGSGVAAVTGCLLALLKQGDHVLCFVETYGPTRYLIKRLLGRYGVTHTMLSITDLQAIEKVLASTPTRLVIFESPTNPLTRIANIAHLTALARRHGALTILDNTFAGLHNHGETDIDVFVHSLTKYASGHGDVMGGAVIGSGELLARMRTDFTIIGATLDPHAAFMIQRGLKTYFLRYREQCANAQRIAEFLAAQPAVLRVHYPGLPGHPGHELARAQMLDFGSIVSFDLRGGLEAGRRFVDALQFFALTASLGSTESLAMAPQMLRSRDLTAEQVLMSGITEGTVRLSIGIEDAEDLLADLAQALQRAES